MRFELTDAFTSPPFQDGALNRSANSPRCITIIKYSVKKARKIFLVGRKSKVESQKSKRIKMMKGTDARVVIE